MALASRLTYLRGRAEAMMPDSAAIVRMTRVPDGSGGFDEVPVTVATVACRLEAVQSGPETDQGGRVAAITGWIAHLPYDTDARPADTLLVTTDTVTAEEYEVVEDTAAQSGSVAQAVTLRRIV
jgi:hypothetical protein